MNFVKSPLQMKLYKYKNAQNINDIERDIKCILEDKIWFSSLELLNDPFEGIINFLYPIGFEYWNLRFQDSTKEYHNQLTKESIKKKTQVGILSLSKTKNNLVLWSHYGNNHKGYVLEYDFDINCFEIDLNHSQIIDCRDVKYSKNPLKMRIFESSYTEFLFNKSLGWKYEKEFRFISKNYGLIKYKKNCLKSIIVGTYCNPIIEEQLIRIAKFKNIDIYKSFINDKNFNLYFKKIK